MDISVHMEKGVFLNETRHQVFSDYLAYFITYTQLYTMDVWMAIANLMALNAMQLLKTATDMFAMDYDAVEHNAFWYSCILPLKKLTLSSSHQIYIIRKVLNEL